MGSRLNVILKRDGMLSVSYSRTRAKNLPIYLCFGPLAAWESLSDHQHSTALFKASRSKTEWLNNDFSSVHNMINGGDEGSVIMDWDEKVLWYFTDFDFEKYGHDFWGSWFASWLDVFWPDWTILRPYTLSFRDIASNLKYQRELDYFDGWEESDSILGRVFHSSYNPVVIVGNIFQSLRNRISHYIDILRYGPPGYREEKSFLAIIEKGALKFYRVLLFRGDDVVKGGLQLIPKRIPSYKFNFKSYIGFLEKHNIIGLVDYDKQQAFFTPGLRGEDTRSFPAWPEWRVRADRQGLCSWIANTNVEWGMDVKDLEDEIDAYFDKILKWCTEVGPDYHSISRSLKSYSLSAFEKSKLKQNPFPRKADSSGSFVFSGDDDNSDIEDWLESEKINQGLRAKAYRKFYEQMKIIYLSDPNLKQKIFVDRHYSNSEWKPDLEVYSWLNQVNPNMM